ncbi:MAG: SEL1-like repeat protein [Myxococcales bacterium]|nr:SEL1-like repeat protein [Myxococcales bacterium]
MKKRAANNANNEARARAHIQRASVLDSEKRHREALVELRAAAALGHCEAMCSIGYMYMVGEGVAKNVAEAHEWYKRAVAAGSLNGMFNLAVDLNNGVPEAGIAPNRAEAVRLVRKAAESGHVGAMHNLGIWLGEDNKDDLEQVVWLRRAAKHGVEEAMFALGKCILNGMGDLEESAATAASWFCKAAEKGSANAMYCLGICYEDGVGVEKNLVTAAEWLERACKMGLMDVQADLERVKKLIAEQQAAKKQTSSSSSTAVTKSPCSACGELTLIRCSGCLEKFYCSHECQHAQWAEHKAECKTKQAKLKEQTK